jgi:Ni/Co efflux regulator RcnB
MKKILTAAIALSVLASAGAASAQSYQGRPAGYQQGYEAPRGDRRDERRDERRDDRGDRRDERRDDRYDRHDRYDRYERRENRYERRAERRYNAGRYYAPRGYQARQWRRGEHLPPQYRGQAYRVDYRYYRLPPPPRGYQYTRVNDDVVLTAIATGLIASVVFNMFQ